MKLTYFFAAFFCLLAWLLLNHYQPWLSIYQDSCIFVAALLLAFGLLQKKYSSSLYCFIYFVNKLYSNYSIFLWSYLFYW